MHIDKQHVEIIAKETLCWPSNRKWTPKDVDKRMRSIFGTPAFMIADLWNRIWDRLGADEKDEVCKKETPQVQYLLYALVLLKVYSSEEVHCSIVGWPTTRTFRKWSWYFVKKISELKDDIIKLGRRFEDIPDDCVANCFISVDGTDCPVFEPWPFDSKMFSHKSNGPALRYEVGVAIFTGFIVWVNGPFKAGTQDSTIFRLNLKHHLYEDEDVEVDRGYRGDEKFKRPDQGSDADTRIKSLKDKSIVRGRHENVNGRLKIFNVLTTYFRHMKPNNLYMKKHQMCFEAVAVITQLKMEFGGEKLYDVEYNENYFF